MFPCIDRRRRPLHGGRLRGWHCGPDSTPVGAASWNPQGALQGFWQVAQQVPLPLSSHGSPGGLSGNDTPSISYPAAGGPYGAIGVDLAFEQLLCRIFGEDFIAKFKRQRPAAWVDLTIAFEARKRTAGPHRAGALNISLPFSFIDFYRKQRGHNVETALRRSRWAQGQEGSGSVC